MSYGVFVDLTSCAAKFRFLLARDHPKRMKLKHDGASWGIITMPCIFAGHIYALHIWPFTEHHTYAQNARSTTAGCRGTGPNHRSLMGQKCLHSLRAAISPHTFFSLCHVHPFLPGEAGGTRRGNNNMNIAVCLMGPVPSIAARELPLIRSGVPPLSDQTSTEDYTTLYRPGIHLVPGFDMF